MLAPNPIRSCVSPGTAHVYRTQVSLPAWVSVGCQDYKSGLSVGWGVSSLGARGDRWNPRLLTPGTCLGRPRCANGDSHRPREGNAVWQGSQIGQTQARRGSYILTLQAHVLNFTFPFIYFFFLNPVSLPEAPNLLFNIGLYD